MLRDVLSPVKDDRSVTPSPATVPPVIILEFLVIEPFQGKAYVTGISPTPVRDSLLPILEKQHSTPLQVLLRRFHVAPFQAGEDLTPLEPYHSRGLTFGKTPGPLHPVVTTGPCILPSIDIRALKADPADYRAIFDRQPTLQNVVSTASQSPGEVHLILETKEFAGLAADLTGLPFADMLDESIIIARRIWDGIQGVGMVGEDVRAHMTHEDKVDATITRFAAEHAEEFFARIPAYHSDPDPQIKRLRKHLEERGPAGMFALRIFASYFPGWWGEEVEAHLVIENMHHYYIQAWDATKVFVPLLPPRSLDGKKEMDEGQAIYVGTAEHAETAIARLQKILPMKTPYGCPVGNLIPYAAVDDDELGIIVDCARDREVDPNRCERCLGVASRLIRSAVAG